MTAPRLTGAEIVALVYCPGEKDWEDADRIEAKLAALVDAVAKWCDQSLDEWSREDACDAVDAAYRALIEEAKR